MGRIRSVVAVVAVSVVVGGAIVTIATIGDESPRDVSRGGEVTDTDGVLSGDKVATLRLEIENLLIEEGEPYTQEDVDRQANEVLELAGDADIIGIVTDDGR